MSLFTTLGSKALIGGIGLIAGAGGIAGIATSSNPAIQSDLTSVHTAIVNKDLASYKTAATQLVNDRSAAQVNRINDTSQADLDTLSEQEVKMDAVQESIKNNDYTSFQANADAGMLKRVSSQADFDKLVANYQSRLTATTAIDTAITNNDFAAYKTALTQNQPAQQSQSNAKNIKRQVLTDTQLQSRFDKLVAAYKADGSFPSTNKLEMRGAFGGGKKRINPRGSLNNQPDSTSPSI